MDSENLGLSMNNFLIIILLISGLSIVGQPSFEKEIFKNRNGEILCRIQYPKNFSESKTYPLVLFLHGAGERGDDNERQLLHGGKLFINEENRAEFLAIVVFPQCPKEDYWASVERTRNIYGERQFNFDNSNPPTQSMQSLLSMADSLVDLSFVDQQRIYVMGLSMGGMGTFEIVRRRPDMFAAAIPICGGGDPKDVSSYSDKTNFWIFHGAKDDVVFPQHSVNMAYALTKAGATPRFTLYKNANHNSWDSAFDESQLLHWLFSQTKNN
jgi:predicted peptidase